MPRPQGIWLEIAEIEYDSDYNDEHCNIPAEEATTPANRAAIVARFRADMDEREPTWYRVHHISPEDASKEYDLFLKWIEKGRILLGRLGVTPGPDARDISIMAIKTKTPKSED